MTPRFQPSTDTFQFRAQFFIYVSAIISNLFARPFSGPFFLIILAPHDDRSSSSEYCVVCSSATTCCLAEGFWILRTPWVSCHCKESREGLRPVVVRTLRSAGCAPACYPWVLDRLLGQWLHPSWTLEDWALRIGFGLLPANDAICIQPDSGKCAHCEGLE